MPLPESADAHEESTVPTDITKQIEILTNVLSYGVLTQEKAEKLGIGMTTSNDRNPLRDVVSLNYIAAKKGVNKSLTNPANGGLTIALERPTRREGRQETMPRTRSELVQELTARVQHTLLVVMPVKHNTRGDASLTVETKDGKQQSGAVMLSDPPTGCMETRASNSICPQNFAFILAPEYLREHVPPNIARQVVFVSSKPQVLRYLGTNDVELECPCYQEELECRIGEGPFENGMLTHMLRCPTLNDINS